MSRFAGWVQYRRGILDHVLNDRITGLEHYALSQLILLADAATGGDRINAPVLCYYCGHAFNHDTAGRILASLHSKGYIWYRAKPYSKKPQPYWVHGYVLTKGLYKLRRINLSQLLDKETISQQDVWNLALQPTEQDTVQPTEQDADNYKTGYMKQETQENYSISTDVCATACGTPRETRQRTSSAASEEGGAEPCAEPSAEPGRRTPSDVGLRWSGYHGAYVDIATGRELAYDESQRRLAAAATGVAIQ